MALNPKNDLGRARRAHMPGGNGVGVDAKDLDFDIGHPVRTGGVDTTMHGMQGREGAIGTAAKNQLGLAGNNPSASVYAGPQRNDCRMTRIAG